MRAMQIAMAAVSIAFGCAREWNAPVEACAEILKTRIPEARVASIAIDAADGASIDYEIGRFWDDPRRGSIACEFELQPDGGLRLGAAALDGHVFTEAEITVINADFMLAAMQRAGAVAP